MDVDICGKFDTSCAEFHHVLNPVHLSIASEGRVMSSKPGPVLGT